MVLGRIFKSKPLPPLNKCELDFSLSDERHTIVAMLTKVVPTLEGSGPEIDTVLDFSLCQYIGPFAAAIIMADHLMSKKNGQQHQVILPNRNHANKKVIAFLDFCGLQHHLFGQPMPNENHPENVTVPLRVVNASNFGLVVPVLALIRRFTNISADDETYLGNCIFEVTQNVEDHAHSAIGAVFCARYLEKVGKIRVAIVDRGDGIATSLRNAGHVIPHTEHALMSVAKGGISARSKPHNRGLGLSNLWDQVIKPMKGDIFIVSEDAVIYSDSQGRMHTETMDVRFAGTAAFFTVPVAEKFR